MKIRPWRARGRILLVLGSSPRTTASFSPFFLPSPDSPRSLDSLGDGYLLARSLDSLGGGNLLRRQLDSLGGGYLLRREAEPLPYYYRREFKRAWDPMG